MIKTILFATDLGAFTSHALLHVELLARQSLARVVIVHAVPPLGEFTAAVVKSHCSESVKREVLGQPHIKGLLDSIRDEIYETLLSADFADLNLGRWVRDVVVAPGRPAAVVLEEAERLSADLIVIGSHSPQALDGRLLGSVATTILQLAKVPVLMVPMAKDPFGTQLASVEAQNDPSQFGT